MDETARDRCWVAALALARTRSSFGVDDVLAAADLDDADESVAREVLGVVTEYGFLQADGEEWSVGEATPERLVASDDLDPTVTLLTAPATRNTFAADPVREWLEGTLEGRVLNLFAGPTRLDHDGEIVRNDLDESVDADLHVDAATAGEHFEPGAFDTVVLDPPLSSWRGEDGAGRNAATGSLAGVKATAAELVAEAGLVVTVGRSLTGMGPGRGFRREQLCLIEHPDRPQDTIAVVERRANPEWADRQ